MGEFIQDLPDCLDVGGATLGQPCAECPFVDEGCTPLRAGTLIVGQSAEIAGQQQTITGLEETLEQRQRTIVGLEETNSRREAENAALFERLFDIRVDTLIDTSVTPSGLKDILTHTPELQEEMSQMNWGVVRLDGRFVGYINRYGDSVGDLFLREGGYEITAISKIGRRSDRRKSQEPIEADHRERVRRSHETEDDILCRQGGDELALFVRDVTTDELVRVASRIQSKLTVSAALARYEENDQIPFIASVGSAHASEKEPEVLGLLAEKNPWRAFLTINYEADREQRAVKSSQYEEMWQKVQNVLKEPKISAPVDREIAAQFLKVLCPNFYKNPRKYLR